MGRRVIMNPGLELGETWHTQANTGKLVSAGKGAQARALDKQISVKERSQILTVVSLEPSFRELQVEKVEWRKGAGSRLVREQLYNPEKFPKARATGLGELDPRDKKNAGSQAT